MNSIEALGAINPTFRMQVVQIMQAPMTKDEAVILANTEWWKQFTAVEVAWLQLNQPRLCLPKFSILHEAVSAALNRSVWTHEFADGASLIRQFQIIHGEGYNINVA